MYEIFAKLMADRGVSAYRVSRDTGISQTTLSDWKRGRSVPKLEKMEKLAEYFGVTVEYLMGRPIKPSPDAVPPTDEEIKLALFGDITVDDEVLEEVKAFARFVQERRMK